MFCARILWAMKRNQIGKRRRCETVKKGLHEFNGDIILTILENILRDPVRVDLNKNENVQLVDHEGNLFKSSARKPILFRSVAMAKYLKSWIPSIHDHLTLHHECSILCFEHWLFKMINCSNNQRMPERLFTLDFITYFVCHKSSFNWGSVNLVKFIYKEKLLKVKKIAWSCLPPFMMPLIPIISTVTLCSPTVQRAPEFFHLNCYH